MLRSHKDTQTNNSTINLCELKLLVDISPINKIGRSLDL